MASKPPEFDPQQMSEHMKQSAQQIWQAGLGAFAKAQQEGSKVFEVPPLVVLIKDSTLNKEEDFANLIEVYFTDPNKLKSYNLKLFEFFKKRYP